MPTEDECPHGYSLEENCPHCDDNAVQATDYEIDEIKKVVEGAQVDYKKPKFMLIIVPIGAILSAAYIYYQSQLECYSFGPTMSFCNDPTGQAFIGAAAIVVIGLAICAAFYWLRWHFTG
jgi:hypothetical protein